jgi:uncharacterized protein (DUF983 family)
MGEKSYKARRASRPTPPLTESNKCPQCGVGILVKIDENFISCTDCGFDVPIKEADDGEVQGT